MKDYLKPSLFASLFALAMPATANQASYHAVPAMMGNAKMGLLCAQAPDLPSRDCQTAVVPDNQRTRSLFPYIPEQFNLLYRDEDSVLFSQHSGYPFVLSQQEGVCYLENRAVAIQENINGYPIYRFDCGAGIEERADLAGIFRDYIRVGGFQVENDAFFYAGITMDILHKALAAMYPDTIAPCESDAEYCLQQLNVVVDGSREPYTSAWDEGRVLLGKGIIGNGTFSDATSLDIIAHETGHALLTWNSEIGYGNGDTSAIQEAFADLTALFVRSEFYKGLQAGGEQNFTESDAYHQLSKDGGAHYVIAWDRYVHNRALRYLYSPRTDGTSIDDWRDKETETPGPHYKAGILNRFFYRLSISDDWSVAKTFHLTMKAAQSCFVEDSSFEHAAFCLLDVAEEQDKARVSAKLQEVGLIPTNSLANNLDFSIERLYTSINYVLAESDQAELSAVNISLNEQPVYQWQSNYNTQSQLNAIKQAQLNLESGEHLLSIETTNEQGQIKTGHRLLSIFSDPLCEPDTENVLSNQLSINGEDFVLEQGYTFLAPQNAWYQQSLGEFRFHNIPTDKVVSVFYDLNRDRQFSDDEKVLSTTEFDTAISLPNVDTVPGDMLVRLRIDDLAVSACTENELSQSVDLKVHIEAGTPRTPIDFSYKQVEQTLHLAVLPVYGEQAMFRWILPEQVIEQTDIKLEREVNAKGAYAISLEHVENDRVLSRAEKQIELIADPNLVIECEAQNTKCILQASHAELADPFEYQWVINNELFKKESNAPFEYDFAEYGEFDVSLVMSKLDGTAEFSTSKKVSLSQPLPHENITIMVRQHNDNVSLSIANVDRFGEEYELIWWLDGEKFTTRQIEKQLAQLASDYEVKLQIRLAGKVVKEVSHSVYMHADIGLDFKWTNDSSKPLLFSFQSL